MSAQYKTTVVGDVERFMGIDGPGVGLACAGHEVTGAITRRGPEPKGAIDVNPSPLRFHDWNDAGKVIKSARADLPCLQDHNRVRGERWQRGGQQSPLGIGCQPVHLIGAKTKKA